MEIMQEDGFFEVFRERFMGSHAIDPLRDAINMSYNEYASK